MFAARQSKKYEVVGSAPSVNLTQMGNAVVPVPYPVSIKLVPSNVVVPYVFFNDKKVYVKKSTTTEVKGDEKGSKKGVVSGTVNGEAVAIVYAPTIKVDGSNLVRVGDMYKMQGGNTVGKLTTTENGKGGSVSANGDVIGPTTPPDLSGKQGSDAWSSALSMLEDPTSLVAKAQDLKSKYDTVSGMLSGEIPLTASGLAGAVGSITGNQSLMQASSMLSQAETAEKMLSGEIPFSPGMALGLAAGATGNPAMSSVAQGIGIIEGLGSSSKPNKSQPSGATPSLVPQNSALKVMLKSDAVSMLGKPLLGAMESQDKATASILSAGLGSLMGSPVLLATAQSTHQYTFPQLLGAIPIDLSITYVSDRFYKGVFGHDRRHSYERAFYWIKGNNFRLDLEDGRWFRFIKQENGSFLDSGNLGVKVTELGQGSYELYYYKSAHKEYYERGKLLKIEDRNGNLIELSYEEVKAVKREHLIKIENASGSSWALSYNQEGLVERVIDHAKRVWYCRYTKEGYLSYITLNKKMEESYGYRLIKRKGIGEKYQLSQVKDAKEQEVLSFSYNQKGEVSGYGEKEEHYRYLWHDLDQIEKRNSSGTSIVYGLDGSRRVSAITYADGSYVNELWDEEKNLAHIHTRGGKTQLKQYDKQQRLLSVTEDEALVEAYEYEGENPYPVSHTKAESTTKYSYDKAYNVTEVIYPDTTTYEYAYNKEGLKVLSRDSMGNETLYEYTPQSTLLKRIDAKGYEQHYKYDVLSRLVTVTIGNHQMHHYRYDHKNRLTNYTNPEGDTLLFNYSQSGKLLSLQDPAKRVTEFRYDEYDRLIAKLYPYEVFEEREEEHYSYNVDNTLSSIKRVDNSKLYFNYDTNQNIVKILADDGKGKVEELSYEYDKLSNLTKAVHNQNRLLLAYDEHNEVNQEVQNGLEVQSLSDEKTTQRKLLTFLEQSFTYDYDKANSLEAIVCNQSSKIKFKYDENALLTQRVYPNSHKESFSYDATYNLVAIDSKALTIEYDHNEQGEVTRKYNHANEDAIVYRYNGRGELLQAGRERYTYSKAGNQIQEGWEYNHKNQLIENPTYFYTYDARGNLKRKINKATKEETHYTFNLFNQLTKVEKVTKDREPIKSFQYSYDALNRRVKKVHQKGEQETTHHYLYDNHNIVAILDKKKKLLATLVHDSQIDTPLSITTHNNALRALTEVEQSYYDQLPKADKAFLDQKRKERTYYYHRDHQGSIHHLTNEQGSVVESFKYDESYGKIITHTKTEETLNPYAYTGREFDTPELYYYRARYYDPTIGRFISFDPIEFLAGDFNFYRYVGCSPVNFVDPSGLWWVWVARLLGFGGKETAKKQVKNEILDTGKEMAKESALEKVAEETGLPVNEMPGMDVGNKKKTGHMKNDSNSVSGEKASTNPQNGGVSNGADGSVQIKGDKASKKNSKKASPNDPNSFDGKSAKEIGEDLESQGFKRNPKAEKAYKDPPNPGESDVQIYTKVDETGKTEITVNNGGGTHTGHKPSDSPVYVKINQPVQTGVKKNTGEPTYQQEKSKVITDKDKYVIPKGKRETEDKKSVVSDSESGKVITEKKQPYTESKDFELTDEGKLQPKKRK